MRRGSITGRRSTRIPNDVAARQSLAMIAETIDHDPAEALRLCEQVARLAPGTQGIDECISRNRARGRESAPSPR